MYFESCGSKSPRRDRYTNGRHCVVDVLFYEVNVIVQFSSASEWLFQVILDGLQIGSSNPTGISILTNNGPGRQTAFGRAGI